MCEMTENDVLDAKQKTDIIFAVIADCVPVTIIKPSKYPYWYKSELIALIKEKERARKTFIKSGRNKNSESFKNFCVLRADIETMLKECHADYVKQITCDIKVKRFCTYVKSLKST